MPGVQIDFEKEVFDKIPLPKRTWIRELVRAAVMGDKEEVVHEHEQVEYVFREGGQVKRGWGVSPADAARKLGLGMTVEWRTVREAEREGWLSKEQQHDPLNV